MAIVQGDNVAGDKGSYRCCSLSRAWPVSLAQAPSARTARSVHGRCCSRRACDRQPCRLQQGAVQGCTGLGVTAALTKLKTAEPRLKPPSGLASCLPKFGANKIMCRIAGMRDFPRRTNSQPKVLVDACGRLAGQHARIMSDVAALGRFCNALAHRSTGASHSAHHTRAAWPKKGSRHSSRYAIGTATSSLQDEPDRHQRDA